MAGSWKCAESTQSFFMPSNLILSAQEFALVAFLPCLLWPITKSSAGICWSRQATETLLSILHKVEYLQCFQTMDRNTDVYQNKSKQMQQQGFCHTECSCCSRFNILKVYVDHATSTGIHCPVNFIICWISFLDIR